MLVRQCRIRKLCSCDIVGCINVVVRHHDPHSCISGLQLLPSIWKQHLFLKRLKTCARVLNFISSLARPGSCVVEVWNIDRFAGQVYSQDSCRVVTGVWNPSQFSFRESESARNGKQPLEGLVETERLNSKQIGTQLKHFVTKLWHLCPSN